jgi:hypothetical protein
MSKGQFAEELAAVANNWQQLRDMDPTAVEPVDGDADCFGMGSRATLTCSVAIGLRRMEAVLALPHGSERSATLHAA